MKYLYTHDWIYNKTNWTFQRTWHTTFCSPKQNGKKKKKKIYGLYKKYLAIIIVDECQKIDSVVSKHVIMNSILDPFTLHSLTV